VAETTRHSDDSAELAVADEPADILSPEDDPAYRVFLDSLNYLSAGRNQTWFARPICLANKRIAGRFRKSGEPYITHPLAVAGAIADWRMDVEGVIAALLHDVMEDTAVGKAEIAERFGKPVADLVDGLSKLDRIEFQSHQDAQAENFRKMLMAMARDLRVVLIKLADRHHNLQTMAAVRAEKRRRIARETLEIYAPIAGRLGLSTSVQRVAGPLVPADLSDARARARAGAESGAWQPAGAAVANSRRHQGQARREANIEAEVFGREKSLYSIYRKMLDKRLSFSQVLDVYGFRVVVKDVPTTYLALGSLHALYKPVPGKFKDYIAIPKPNGYQSLHTTLIGPHGTPFEVQIRTAAMDKVAQEGIASHWLYKDSESLGEELQQKTTKWFHSLAGIAEHRR
jgi:guanosine-3',5'-bis(diphosphate) 3'-pyrophosphohydrolase